MTEIDDGTYRIDRAVAAHRARYGVVFTWLAIGCFVLAFILLTSDGWDGSQLCGSPISNPGWSDGQGCFDVVYRRALFGWLVVIGGGISLCVAANYTWGAGWHRQRRSDGFVSD